MRLKKVVLLISVFWVVVFCICQGTWAEVSIRDFRGKEVVLEEPAHRIISLYTAHTESLYFLGAQENLIAVSTSCDFPPEVALKKIVDYRSDPEKAIALKPDAVLVRDYVVTNYPRFVEALEGVGIPVIDLNPEHLADLDDYFAALGAITGLTGQARELSESFHQEIARIVAKISNIPPEQRKKVFFESVAKDYKTVTPGTLVDELIALAGGINVASSARPVRSGSRIAAFGIERLLSLADEIDVYIAQRGVMNRVTRKSILERPELRSLRAVKEGRVYVVDEAIVSRPGPRLSWGLEELARMLYPEIFEDLKEFAFPEAISRAVAAQAVVWGLGIPLYVPTKKDFKTEGYVAGKCEDLSWSDSFSRYVETLIHTGAAVPEQKEGKFFFHPDQPLTRVELARWLYILLDFEVENGDFPVLVDINSLSRADQTAVLVTVASGIFDGLISGKHFEPYRPLTGEELVKILERAREKGRRGFFFER